MTARSLAGLAPRAELVGLFASELARYVGRGVRRLRRDGLLAGDFDGEVLVDFADGSTMTFTHAIAVRHTSRKIGIFTEHCGFYVFESADIRVSRVWDGHVFHRYGDLRDVEPDGTGSVVVSGRRYVAVPFAAYERLRGAEPLTDAIAFTRLSIARDLRFARRQAGLTQRALAKRLGTPMKTVCKTECGRRHVTESYVRKVLAACGLPTDWRAPSRS